MLLQKLFNRQFCVAISETKIMIEQLNTLMICNFNASTLSYIATGCNSTANNPDAKRVIWMRMHSALRTDQGCKRGVAQPAY